MENTFHGNENKNKKEKEKKNHGVAILMWDKKRLVTLNWKQNILKPMGCRILMDAYIEKKLKQYTKLYTSRN